MEDNLMEDVPRLDCLKLRAVVKKWRDTLGGNSAYATNSKSGHVKNNAAVQYCSITPPTENLIERHSKGSSKTKARQALRHTLMVFLADPLF
mmetsp:Transcript_7869/g.18206  ORF Transcript_7869/g.18206 Transcript_7869/m.18206 type:complete len:92 (-) Transcript_7869:489-764(-)